MKDQKSLLKVVEAVAPTSGKVTTTAIAIDRQGYESLTITSVLGACAFTGSAYITPTLTESDNGTDYTAVAANKYIGDLTPVKATLAANKVSTIGYIGDKRYVKFSFVVTGTLPTDVDLVALGILGHPHLAPVA